jgi:hypothetical protein
MLFSSQQTDAPVLSLSLSLSMDFNSLCLYLRPSLFFLLNVNFSLTGAAVDAKTLMQDDSVRWRLKDMSLDNPIYELKVLQNSLPITFAFVALLHKHIHMYVKLHSFVH